jgi:lipopolysaccharide export system protein LptC
MERFSLAFPLVLLALLAGLSFWLDRIVQPNSPPRDGSSRHDPDYIVENFVAVRMGVDGMPQHQLEAKRMKHYPDDDTTHLETPHFVSFAGERPDISIVSKTALLSNEGRTVDFNGDVRTVRMATASSNELVLTTQHLRVIPDDKIARTDDPVTIEDANTKITAVGLEFDDNARTVKLKSKVRGSYVRPKK